MKMVFHFLVGQRTMKSPIFLFFNWPKSAHIPITFVMFLFSCVYIFYEIRS